MATQGISVSQFNTGVNYSLGRGIEISKRPFIGTKEPMNKVTPGAPFNIALIYADGINLDPDPELALDYLLIAEERNNRDAKRFLNKLREQENLKLERP